MGSLLAGIWADKLTVLPRPKALVWQIEHGPRSVARVDTSRRSRYDSN
jgi:hypothetical protein